MLNPRRYQDLDHLIRRHQYPEITVFVKATNAETSQNRNLFRIRCFSVFVGNEWTKIQTCKGCCFRLCGTPHLLVTAVGVLWSHFIPSPCVWLWFIATSNPKSIMKPPQVCGKNIDPIDPDGFTAIQDASN